MIEAGYGCCRDGGNWLHPLSLLSSPCSSAAMGSLNAYSVK